MNTDTLIGCFGYNKVFPINEEEDYGESDLEDCKSIAEKNKNNFYAHDGSRCYGIKNISSLVRFKNSIPCENSGDYNDDNFDNLKKIKIYKTESKDPTLNIQKNFVYENSYYKITSDFKDFKGKTYTYQYEYDDSGFLNGVKKDNESNSKNTVQFKRVTSKDDKFSQITYNEKIKIKFNVGGKSKN